MRKTKERERFLLDFIYFKALKEDIFRSYSRKNQALSTTENEIQVLPRSWNETSEIQGFQGFSRRAVRALLDSRSFLSRH